MLPLSPCYVVKNKRVPEAPGPFCRPGNSQSFADYITTKLLLRKLIRRRERCP